MPKREPTSTIGGPCCAHARVSYRTKPVGGGAVTGYWECDSGCGMRFAPQPEALATPMPAEPACGHEWGGYRCDRPVGHESALHGVRGLCEWADSTPLPVTTKDERTHD